MSTFSVAFHMEDEDEVEIDDKFVYPRTASTTISRLCFRCDTRSPDEIFPGGFTNRDFEDALLQLIEETVEQVRLETDTDIKPVLNPVRGVAQQNWKKPMLHPFSPGSVGATIYEPKFAELQELQMPQYRNFDFPGKPAMYDINPSTGVALTYYPQFAPLFPIDRGADFKADVWVYAVWVEDAVKTYKRQKIDRPDIADIREVVVQYVPFHRVLVAVPCKRVQFGKAVYPLEFTMGGDPVQNLHSGPEHKTDAIAALQPWLGKRCTIVKNVDGWKAMPY